MAVRRLLSPQSIDWQRRIRYADVSKISMGAYNAIMPIRKIIVKRGKGYMPMGWTLLFIAGLFEVAWAIGLGYSDGLSKPIPAIGTVIALIISMVLLAKAVENLPIGTAYAVWTGIGAVGTTILGIALFDESATFARLAFISVIVFGIVGLHFVSNGA